MKAKRMICGLMCMAMMMPMAACSKNAAEEANAASTSAASPTTESTVNVSVVNEAEMPKYVFLFIGDGMSYPQFQATSDYLGAIADDDFEKALPSVKAEERDGAVLDGPVKLNFMNRRTGRSAWSALST